MEGASQRYSISADITSTFLGSSESAVCNSLFTSRDNVIILNMLGRFAIWSSETEASCR